MDSSLPPETETEGDQMMESETCHLSCLLKADTMRRVHGHRNLRRRTLAFIWALALPGSASAVTIAVGGWDSQRDPNPGIFVTARLVDPAAVCRTLPGGVVLTDYYRRTEQALFNRAKAALDAGEPVTLFGYSHGATMVLRIAHKLANETDRIHNVKLVTIDRIAAGYPLLLWPHYDSVPNGLALAFNVFHKGGKVTGAENVPATNDITFEKTRGALADPTDPRFKQHYHQYIQNSYEVRRKILANFQAPGYLPGIWHMQVAGRVEGDHVDFALYYLLSITRQRRYQFRAWTHLKEFDLMSAIIEGRAIRAGRFNFVTHAPGCPSLGVDGAVGTFLGNVAEAYNQMTLYLNGSWPMYRKNPCRDAGTAVFQAEARAVLAHAGAAAQGQREQWWSSKKLQKRGPSGRLGSGGPPADAAGDAPIPMEILFGQVSVE